MNLPSLWQSLEADAQVSDSGHLRRRIGPESGCDFYLAISRPSNDRLLLVRLTEATRVVTTKLPEFRGLKLEFSVAVGDVPNATYTLQLRLTEPSFADVFNALIEDLVDCANRAPTEALAIAAIVDRLATWQRFLGRIPPEGLSEESQRGLFGELLFLQEILIPMVGVHDAITAWRGPKGAHQDFQLRGIAIEIKTSIAIQPQHIRIANERQLDPAGYEMLILFLASLDRRMGSGRTLPQMALSLREIAQGSGLLNVLDDLLLEAGYLREHEVRYQDIGYFERHRDFFHVQENFPRILEGDLRSGVGDVEYSISVAESRRSAIPQERLADLLREAEHER